MEAVTAEAAAPRDMRRCLLAGCRGIRPFLAASSTKLRGSAEAPMEGPLDRAVEDWAVLAEAARPVVPSTSQS